MNKYTEAFTQTWETNPIFRWILTAIALLSAITLGVSLA